MAKKVVKKEEETKKKKSESDYTAKDIFILKGLEPVRRRPGMYIGSTGPEGLHHLLKEVVGNAIDEAMMGYCNEIRVTLLPNNQVSVADNGRGIPVDIHPQTRKPALETIMTTLHSGGKFGGKAYAATGGLHGIGLAAVCALSDYVRVEVCRDNHLYFQEYSRGKATMKLKKSGRCDNQGTTVFFSPDLQIFKKIEWNAKAILRYLRQQAFLTKGVKIIFEDKSTKNPFSYTFYFEGGLVSYIQHLTRGRTPRHDNIFYVNDAKDDIVVEAALVYTKEFESFEGSFANNIFTAEGGSHLTGLRIAVTRTLNDYAKKENLIKKEDDGLDGKDTREGLTAIVSIKIKEPQFEGQTKNRLGNIEARAIVAELVSEHFADFLERNRKDGRAIIESCLLAQKARSAASKARQTIFKKGISRFLALPGKLADCSSRHPERSELYLLEGISAGGCFAGETKVALTDGRNLAFKDLVEEHKKGIKNYCYTIKEDGRMGIGPIQNPRKTKSKTEVIKIILDNDEEIICTPDHRFMLREGFYKEAENLNSQDSLMPLRRQFSRMGKRITIEAVLNYNHKIKKIVKLKERIDVYDFEVEGTHNFALASGVFVHNSAKQARDRRFQAILPLRGKILNIEKARLDKILASSEVKALIIALGTSIGEEFDITGLRYHRVIIMADADVDGMHIRTLLLTLFFRYLRPIIEAGYLYVAQPPLYSIQVGKEMKYAFTEGEKDRIVAELKKKDARMHIQRYKGLGEMNPEQLWETTMNPENRILLRVAIEDAEEADRVFDILMGEEVAPRKKFIQLHAKKVTNLDI